VDSAKKLIQKIFAGRKGANAQDYIKAMKEQITNLSARVDTLDKMIDAESKTAREMGLFQIEEDRLRSNIDSLRNTLKVLDSLLTGDESPKRK
jgi:hypothetical protein